MASKPIVIDNSLIDVNIDQPNQKPLPNTSSNDENTLNIILKSLECPACNEIYRSPIFICSKGHNICGGCKNKPTTNVVGCFICKSTITDQRNLALEDIINKCASKCSNEKFGCKYVSIKEKIPNHQKKCTFNPIKCPYGTTFNQCKWEGLYSDLFTHFQNLHPDKLSVKGGQETSLKNVDLNVPYQDLQLITTGNHGYFLYHFEIDVKNNLAHWTLQKTEANNFKIFYYDFTIYHHKKNMKITEECASKSSTLKTIFQSGNCFSIPLNVLKNYINAGKELTLKINIKYHGYKSNVFQGNKSFISWRNSKKE